MLKVCLFGEVACLSLKDMSLDGELACIIESLGTDEYPTLINETHCILIAADKGS